MSYYKEMLNKFWFRGALLIWTALCFAKYTFGQYTYNEPASPRRANLTYEQLIGIINRHHVRSVDQLLPLLPEEYRRYYTLMHDSQSLQAASAVSPRIIFYGGDGRLMLGVQGAGNASNRGAESLEVIAFNEARNRFETHEIRFPPRGRGQAHVENNPRSCVRCHQSGGEIHPNFPQYNNWPGAFGSLGREHVEVIVRGSEEDRRYQQFVEQSQGRGRFQWLPRLTPEQIQQQREDFARAYGIQMSDLAFNPAFHRIFPNGATSAPNQLLNVHIEELNSLRMARTIVRHPHLDAFVPLLAALNNHCILPIMARMHVADAIGQRCRTEQPLDCLPTFSANDPTAILPRARLLATAWGQEIERALNRFLPEHFRRSPQSISDLVSLVGAGIVEDGFATIQVQERFQSEGGAFRPFLHMPYEDSRALVREGGIVSNQDSDGAFLLRVAIFTRFGIQWDAFNSSFSQRYFMNAGHNRLEVLRQLLERELPPSVR